MYAAAARPRQRPRTFAGAPSRRPHLSPYAWRVSRGNCATGGTHGADDLGLAAPGDGSHAGRAPWTETSCL